jgi:hypothetical protein
VLSINLKEPWVSIAGAHSSRRGRVAAIASGALCAGLVLAAGAVDPRPVAASPVAAASEALVPGVQALGSNATISGDGRFVARQGAPDGAAPTDARSSTIHLTDRVTGVTTELTTVPSGQRPGDSINPVLAADGCSVVVTTELALDVFRDNDGGDRWDVYRQRLTHCGGTPGNWELVSSRADGLARDDVSSTDHAAVSRSGALIVYTHPADEFLGDANLTALSIVDVTQAHGSADRSRPVAGMPITSPDTVFVHGGLDQPAISGDGRFVAYRSDALSSDAVPGWGSGPIEGGPAARQVFVWDRAELDPFAAVTLVSERVDGSPTISGAADPVLSRDGRVVAFTSTDIGLSTAVSTPCGDVCPSQVYHLDRDPDLNGRFDEPARTTMTLLSSEPGTTPAVAGTAPSSQPALSADGQLVAFITKATNLQLVPAAGGGDPADGDLLVADVARRTLRRVTTLDGGARPALGAHSAPAVSDTGRSIAFDTLAAQELVPDSSPGRHVLVSVSAPTLTLSDADLGPTLVGLSSDEWYVAVINSGPSTFVPSEVTIDDPRFEIDREASTCALAVPVPPGGDCTVRLTFTPGEPGPAAATLTVAERGFQAVSISSTVRGAGGEPALRTNPAGGDFGSVVVGDTSAEFLFDVENISFEPITVSSVLVGGADMFDFAVTSNSCFGRVLNPRTTCSIGLSFSPAASGQRSAMVEIMTSTGAYAVMLASGQGRFSPSLVVDQTEVDAGSSVGIGGSGFPPSTPMSVFFDDDPGERVELVTNEFGDFLLQLPVSATERGGDRVLVAQAADGTGATASLEVIELHSAMVGMPGFGLG